MKCCKCAQDIPDDSTFCLKCGAKQSIVDIEELVALVEEKLSITNYAFSEKGKLDCQKWINEFGFDAVCEAVEIAIQQYLMFDGESKPIKHSVDEVFNKIPGICANKKNQKEKPYIGDALQIFNYSKKKFRLNGWLSKDYKIYIERVLFLLFQSEDNYQKAFEDFFWEMKRADDEYDFLDEMKDMVSTLEKGDKI